MPNSKPRALVPTGAEVPLFQETAPMDPKFLKTKKDTRMVSFKASRALIDRLLALGVNVSLVCRDALMRVDLELRSGGLASSDHATKAPKAPRQAKKNKTPYK